MNKSGVARQQYAKEQGEKEARSQDGGWPRPDLKLSGPLPLLPGAKQATAKFV